MQEEKVLEALNVLKERGIIISNSYNRFVFTGQGRQFTKQKSGNSWISITNGNLKYLWARYNVKVNDSWTFIKIEDLIEEQFDDFCNYFEIKLGPDLYDVDDEFEDI